MATPIIAPPMLLYNIDTVTVTTGQPFVTFPIDGWIKVIDMHDWDSDSGPNGMAVFCTTQAFKGRGDQYIHLVSNIYLEANRTCGIVGSIPVRRNWAAQATMEGCTVSDRCELRILFQGNPYGFQG